MNESQISNTSFHPNVKDITGQRFGYLVVLRKSGKDIHRNIIWLCKCDCGVEKPISGLTLRQGRTKSCGCKAVEMIAKAKTKHGQSQSRRGGTQSRAYSCWNNLKSRAASNKTLEARKYAKRDLTVCEKWKTFEGFLEDMGECPSPGHSIDRINNDLGYSKENCRWASHTEQQRNKSSNRLLEFNGRTMCVAEFAELVGAKYHAVAAKVRAGISPSEIMAHFQMKAECSGSTSGLGGTSITPSTMSASISTC